MSVESSMGINLSEGRAQYATRRLKSGYITSRKRIIYTATTVQGHGPPISGLRKSLEWILRPLERT